MSDLINRAMRSAHRVEGVNPTDMTAAYGKAYDRLWRLEMMRLAEAEAKAEAREEEFWANIDAYFNRFA